MFWERVDILAPTQLHFINQLSEICGHELLVESISEI